MKPERAVRRFSRIRESMIPLSARLGRAAVFRLPGGLRWVLLWGLALALSVLGTWMTFAQALDVELVSTFGTGVDVVTQSNRQKVVAFITGPNQTGYTLNSITIAFSSDSGQTGTVSLHEGTPTGGASTMPAAVGTFNNPSSISSGLATYTAASPVQLEAGTKYSVSYRDTLTGTDFTPQVGSVFTGQFGFLALRTSWYRRAGAGNFTKTNNTAQRIMYKLNGSVNTTTNEVLVSNKVTSKDHNLGNQLGKCEPRRSTVHHRYADRQITGICCIEVEARPSLNGHR